MVKVPLHKEGLQVKIKCTLENVSVIFVPSLETHKADSGCPSLIYLLDMETGKLALLPSFPNALTRAIYGLLNRIYLYMHGNSIIINEQTEMTLRRVKLLGDPRVVWVRPRNHYTGDCVKGYIPYSDHEVVDLRNRRVFKVPYEG